MSVQLGRTSARPACADRSLIMQFIELAPGPKITVYLPRGESRRGCRPLPNRPALSTFRRFATRPCENSRFSPVLSEAQRCRGEHGRAQQGRRKSNTRRKVQDASEVAAAPATVVRDGFGCANTPALNCGVWRCLVMVQAEVDGAPSTVGKWMRSLHVCHDHLFSTRHSYAVATAPHGS